MRGEEVIQATQSAVTNNEYRNISIAALVESGTNPRNGSIRLRWKTSREFQNAGHSLAPAGTRTGGKQIRSRSGSASSAGRPHRGTRKPSRPHRKLTDAEAIEAQCVENLQRQDIHPLEEALGFRALLELGEPVYSIATIAARTAKSEAYIYGRIRLADLIPPVAEAS